MELGALKNTSDHRQAKLEFDQQDDQLFSLSHEIMNNPPLRLQNTHGIGDHGECPGVKSKPLVKEQVMPVKFHCSQFSMYPCLTVSW